MIFSYQYRLNNPSIPVPVSTASSLSPVRVAVTPNCKADSLAINFGSSDRKTALQIIRESKLPEILYSFSSGGTKKSRFSKVNHKYLDINQKHPLVDALAKLPISNVDKKELMSFLVSALKDCIEGAYKHKGVFTVNGNSVSEGPLRGVHPFDRDTRPDKKMQEQHRTADELPVLQGYNVESFIGSFLPQFLNEFGTKNPYPAWNMIRILANDPTLKITLDQAFQKTRDLATINPLLLGMAIGHEENRKRALPTNTKLLPDLHTMSYRSHQYIERFYQQVMQIRGKGLLAQISPERLQKRLEIISQIGYATTPYGTSSHYSPMYSLLLFAALPINDETWHQKLESVFSHKRSVSSAYGYPFYNYHQIPFQYLEDCLKDIGNSLKGEWQLAIADAAFTPEKLEDGGPRINEYHAVYQVPSNIV